MSDEWGPWIEHDMLGIKPYGAGIRYQLEYGFPNGNVAGRREGVSSNPKGRHLGWHRDDYINHRFWVVIRYRIRKPKGLTIIESILREVERDKVIEYND